MAITKPETQVTWPTAANSISVTAGSSQTSEVITLDATCVDATIHLKADNSTTPATDDQIYFWLLQTGGDPDGTGADEYATAGHATLLGVVDTYAEDPAIKSVPLPAINKSCKIYAEGVTAGTTNAITVSCTITELRVA